MRVGIMLRHYEQHTGGVKVYTQNLMSHLLSLESKNQYVLIYQNPKLIGTYSNYPNVDEVAVPIPGTILWDQLAVPWVVKKKRLDLVFNPKFTVPFLSRAKKVFVLHGSEWFVIPEAFLWYDRWYFRRSVPLYCRHADAFITVSNTVKSDVVKHTGVNASKVFPIHNGFDSNVFRVIRDPHRLEAVRQKYQLPEQFILWSGQIYPPKNVGRLIQAFAQIKDQIPHQLVFAGEQRWRTKEAFELIEKLGLQNRLHFAGWVSHEDLPCFYNLAQLFALPSLYEGFGIPLIESMACGCPVLTSNTCSPPEVTAGAAYLVNPLSVDEIAEGIREVLLNSLLRESMIAKGLERSKCFGWEKCAREVLAVFNSLNGVSR
jgi:glycosyltransferase involved in cell wall biosynthesis